MANLRTTHPSFVRCIIPNEQKKPGMTASFVPVVNLIYIPQCVSIFGALSLSEPLLIHPPS